MYLQDPGLLRHQAYIGGTWRNADNNQVFTVTDPATGDTLAEVASLGATETQQAIQIASAAQKEWQKVPAKERARIMRIWPHMFIPAA